MGKHFNQTLKNTLNQRFSLSGPKAWSATEIISLCENLSGQEAEIRNIPTILINLSKNLTSFFEWSWPVANRLLFIQVLDDLSVSAKETQKVCEIFSLKTEEFSTLEKYFKEYFEQILQDLQKLNFQKPKDILF